MKILHCSGSKIWRGGEQQLLHLLKYLPKEAQSYLLAPKGCVLLSKLTTTTIPSFSFTKRMGLDINGALALKRIVRDLSIDIIHLHDPHAHNIYLLAYLFLGVKTSAVLHRRVDFLTGKSFLSRFKYNLSGIKKIICVSEKVAAVLAPIIRENNKKITVIHSGIDLQRFQHTGRNHFIADQLQIPISSKIIGNVAALAAHKDHFTFIQTAFLLCRENKLLFFVIAGVGDREKKIQLEINRLGLEKTVFLFGHTDDIPSFLRSLDIFLFTSCEEGLGTAILEALAVGVPVVSTRAGGIPEIIIHGENGLLADVGDAQTLAHHCNNILDDKDLKDSLIKNGHITSKKFSCEMTAKEVFSVYLDIIPHA